MIGKIIAFEGIDGSGKSTFINSNKVGNLLKKFGIESELSAEFPQTQSDIRSQFREILMSDIDPMQELLTVSIARTWHYSHIMKPLLCKDTYVIMDRFIDSTYAYQGVSIQKETIDYFAHNIWLTPQPDVVIYFEPMQNAKKGEDRIEMRSIDYFNKVKDIYDSRKNINWICVSRDNMIDCEIDIKIESELIKILELN